MNSLSKWLITSVSLLSMSGLSAAAATQKPAEKKEMKQEEKEPFYKKRQRESEQWGGRSRNRIDMDNGYFAYADALVWRGHFRDGMGTKLKFTSKTIDLNGAPIPVGALKEKHPEPHFDWGYRLGVGWLPAFDDWEVSFDWTHISLKWAKSVGSPNAISPFTENFPQGFIIGADKVNNSVRNILNTGDLLLKREFMVTKRIAIMPGVGLEFFRSHETLKYAYTNVITAVPDAFVAPSNPTFRGKNEFWGLGPKGTVKGRWLLGWGFSLAGDFGAALLYGRLNTKFKYYFTEKAVPILFPPNKISSGVRLTVPTINATLGIEWNRFFRDGKWRLNAHIGWEHHTYFQLLQNDVGEYLDRNNGNLSTEGVTFGARFDF